MELKFTFGNIVLTFIITLYSCTLFERIQFVDSYDNNYKNKSNSWPKLDRQKGSINYKYSRKVGSGLDNNLNNQMAVQTRSNKQLMKVRNPLKQIHNYGGVDFSDSKDQPKPWAKDDAASAKDNAKAEEVIDPDKPKRIMARVSAPKVRNLEVETSITNLLLPNCGTFQKNSERVVNGKDAPQGAYPWAVVILKSGDAWCGGTIINEQWVLTAAHCFMQDQSASSYAIRVGSVNRNEGQGYKVEKLLVHERFHLDNMFNSDIALLKIAKKIKMSKDVNAICLPSKIYEEPTAKTFTVIGWGQTSYENKDLPSILQEVKLNIVSIEECAKKYKTKGNTIYRSQVCTWNEKQDACQGDSGSSATEWRDQKAYQVGIVSYGSTCADDFPGVYTKVSYFLQWIVNTIKKN